MGVDGLRWTGLAAALVATASSASAEKIAIRVGEPLPRFEKLKPGTRTYIRYKLSPDGDAEVLDIQTKEVRFEGQAGSRDVRVLQRWDGPNGSLRLDSLAEDKTLRPITHQRDLHKDGTIRREGFRFLPGTVAGIPDQPGNIRKDFEIAAPVPPFNFEIDMETLTTLPLRRGAEFEIVFYHPGGGPPAPYIFKVAGDERLSIGGEAIDCWVVTTDYNRPEIPPSRFWVAKGSQIVVRVENPLPGGGA